MRAASLGTSKLSANPFEEKYFLTKDHDFHCRVRVQIEETDSKLEWKILSTRCFKKIKHGPDECTFIRYGDVKIAGKTSKLMSQSMSCMSLTPEELEKTEIILPLDLVECNEAKINAYFAFSTDKELEEELLSRKDLENQSYKSKFEPELFKSRLTNIHL